MLRTLALTREDALTPFLSELVPSVVGLVQQTLGPTKLAAERTLARILHVHTRTSALAWPQAWPQRATRSLCILQIDW